MEIGKDEIWFIVDPQDGERFLQFAKDHGCVWVNENEINPKTDRCGYHMGMGNYHIGYVAAMIWGYCAKHKTVIDFKTIK